MAVHSKRGALPSALGYNQFMADYAPLSAASVALARKRRLAAMRLQDIEGNPLSADQVEMFEMFEREAWPHERRLAYLLEKVLPLAAE
jgi:hypothetical protein